MCRLAAAIILSSAAFAQSAHDAEVAVAVKSPAALARYVESHSTVDWKALRSTLGLKESQDWLAPCASNFPAAEAPCAAETVTVANPEQAIVVIRGGEFSYTVEYLRYLQDTKGGWQFAGENSAFKKDGPSNHEVMRVGGKPFLKISSDHTQGGVGVSQELEDWFDLTQPDFEPVFSFTPQGSAGGFGFSVSRTIEAACALSESSGLERIDMTLSIVFNGALSPGVYATYRGVYYRSANEKKFTLRSAGPGLFGGAALSTKDFEDLADPFSGPSLERYLVYALAGLQKIATGPDADAKAWLREILDRTGDTPEKRTLLELLAKP